VCAARAVTASTRPANRHPWYAGTMACPENDDKAEIDKNTQPVDDDATPCPIYDQLTDRPCGKPMEPGTLTCKEHATRSSSTQISRLDAARRRYGV